MDQSDEIKALRERLEQLSGKIADQQNQINLLQQRLDAKETDENAFIGLTVHSYAISAILRAARLPELRVREGSGIALLVKRQKIDRNN